MPASVTHAMRWQALYVEFRRWRTDDVESIASSFFTGPGIDRKQHEVLPYNSKTWWACLIFLRLRNFDLVLRKHTSVKNKPPEMALGVPIVEEHADKHASDTSGSEGGRSPQPVMSMLISMHPNRTLLMKSTVQKS